MPDYHGFHQTGLNSRLDRSQLELKALHMIGNRKGGRALRMQDQLDSLKNELCREAGFVPASIANPISQAPTFMISETEFLLRVPNGLRFHYRRGEGVRYEQPDGVDDQDVELFAASTVSAAVAFMNGLIVMHVSAVEHEGEVYAFAAASGAGKSTLAAGLQKRGFTLYCDDTLLLHLENDQVLCAPNQHRLKLWEDALEMTENDRGPQVRRGVNKFFINGNMANKQSIRPLNSIFFLDYNDSKQFIISNIVGSMQMVMLSSSVHRPRIAFSILNSKRRFTVFSKIAKSCKILHFQRPRNRKMYWDGVDKISDLIRAGVQL